MVTEDLSSGLQVEAKGKGRLTLTLFASCHTARNARCWITMDDSAPGTPPARTESPRPPSPPPPSSRTDSTAAEPLQSGLRGRDLRQVAEAMRKALDDLDAKEERILEPEQLVAAGDDGGRTRRDGGAATGPGARRPLSFVIIVNLSEAYEVLGLSEATAGAEVEERFYTSCVPQLSEPVHARPNQTSLLPTRYLRPTAISPARNLTPLTGPQRCRIRRQRSRSRSWRSDLPSRPPSPRTPPSQRRAPLDPVPQSHHAPHEARRSSCSRYL